MAPGSRIFDDSFPIVPQFVTRIYPVPGIFTPNFVSLFTSSLTFFGQNLFPSIVFEMGASVINHGHGIFVREALGYGLA